MSRLLRMIIPNGMLLRAVDLSLIDQQGGTLAHLSLSLSVHFLSSQIQI